MRVVYERCCGLDIYKKTVVACVLITLETGEVQRSVRTFLTMTAGLLALADWLESLQVTVVAMESTGVYWRPVFNFSGRGSHDHSGQCSAHEGSSRPQNRYQR